MTDIWTPSDRLLLADPIAEAKVAHPHDADPDVVLAASVLVDDEADAEAAAVTLAMVAGDDVSASDELVLVDDLDQDVDDVGAPSSEVSNV